MNDKQAHRFSKLEKCYTITSFEEDPDGRLKLKLNGWYDVFIMLDGTVKDNPPKSLCDGCVHDFNPIIVGGKQ